MDRGNREGAVQDCNEQSSLVPNTGRTRKEICLFGIKEGRIYIVLGLVTLAVVFSMMTVNWTNMIYNEKDSKAMLFGVLITSILIGIICILSLIVSTSCSNDGQIRTGKRNSIYELVKIIAVVLFGFCNLAHCAFFIFKHANSSSGCSHKREGIAYNVLSIIYTLLLIIEISVVKVLNESTLHRFLSVGILFANFSFWLDTIFSESNSIFNHGDGMEATPLNHANITTFCNYTKESIKLIEKADPVLSICTVEFAIITVDLIFSTIKKDNSPQVVQTETDGHNTQSIQPGNSNGMQVVKTVVPLLFLMLSFALFVISILGFTEGSSNGEGNGEEKDSLTLSIYFKLYIVTSSVIKLTMFVCVTLCTVLSWGSFKYTFNIEGLILMMSCFGNIIYHMFYLFAVWKSYMDILEEGVKPFLGFTYFDNVVSIIVAAEQTIFILAIENGENMSQNRRKNLVYNVCILLFINNAGLWISDSFGESKLPVLSVIIERNYSKTFWIIFTKLVLPITIFFRIHSGLILLKMYCYRDWHGQEQRSQPNSEELQVQK